MFFTRLEIRYKLEENYCCPVLIRKVNDPALLVKTETNTSRKEDYTFEVMLCLSRTKEQKQKSRYR